jgi:coatomer subunit gamma
LKFPAKYATLLAFLSGALREEGVFKYKKSIVDAMISIIGEIREATELGLEQFCEFIEDCEYPELSVRVLHLLGEKGPQTSNPAKYIRYIFNRVILETASVRSAAVSSLAKFGTAVPALRENCIVLLKRCLNDHDDEVRDRAVFYLNILQSERSTKALLEPRPFPSLHQLEVSLQRYCAKPQNEPFSLTRHLVQVSEEQVAIAEGDVAQLAAVKKQKELEVQREQKAKQAADRAAGIVINPHMELLNSIPELKALGVPFKSSSPVELTEPETEYVVSCVKHIYQRHVVFQFSVTNNLEDHCLEAVSVAMESDDPEWQEEFAIPETSIKHGSTGTAFVAFTRPSENFTSGPLHCTLKFTSKEVEDGEVAPEGHEDEYALEEVDVSEADFMRAGDNIGLLEFRRQWESLGETVEVLKKYSLNADSLQGAVNAVVELLGMQPCENSQSVPDNAKSHAVNLTGMFFGGIPVLARTGFQVDPKHGGTVTMKIAVRSMNASINNTLANAIR